MQYSQGMRVIISHTESGIIANQHPHNEKIWFVCSKGSAYPLHENELNKLFENRMICVNCGENADIDESLMCENCWCKSLHQGKPCLCKINKVNQLSDTINDEILKISDETHLSRDFIEFALFDIFKGVKK